MTHGPGELSEKGSGNYQMFQLFLWHFTKLKIRLIYSLHFAENIALDTHSKPIWGFPYAYINENNIQYSICFLLKHIFKIRIYFDYFLKDWSTVFHKWKILKTEKWEGKVQEYLEREHSRSDHFMVYSKINSKADMAKVEW